MEYKYKVETYSNDGQNMKNNLFYLGLIFVIALVSCYDTAITYISRESIILHEQNPICLFIMEEVGVHNFILYKSAGTLAVVAILIGMVFSRRRFPKTMRIVRSVIWSIFFVQVILFLYLTFWGPFSPSEVYSLLKLVAYFYSEFYN